MRRVSKAITDTSAYFSIDLYSVWQTGDCFFKLTLCPVHIDSLQWINAGPPSGLLTVRYLGTFCTVLTLGRSLGQE